MSSSHHDDHHVSEQKPVAFTVPLIMASVLVLIIILFLSLCDPKPHHAGEAGHGEPMAPMEASHHEATEHKGDAVHASDPAMTTDSATQETAAPPAEATPEHH